MLKKKILIIGGTGFIGYHLAKKCIKKNWKVVSISKNKPTKNRFLKKVDYKICDISEKKKLSNMLKGKFNYVVNLGGYIDHANKKKAYNGHYFGVKNLYDIFKNKGITSFIQVGSSAEYGLSLSPHKEEDLCKPILTYGNFKLQATKFLLNAYKKNNFPVTILRFYQIYGPKQNIDRFIPLLINACLTKITFISSHGKQSRDFLYVDDAINAIILAIKKKECKGRVINIGSAKPLTLLSIMKYTKKKNRLG